MLLKLSRVGVPHQLVDAQIAVRAIAQRHRARAAAQLLHGNAVGSVSKLQPAIFRWHRDTVQTEVAHLSPQVDICWKRVRFVDRRCVRRDHTARKFADVFAELRQLLLRHDARGVFTWQYRHVRLPQQRARAHGAEGVSPQARETGDCQPSACQPRRKKRCQHFGDDDVVTPGRLVTATSPSNRNVAVAQAQELTARLREGGQRKRPASG
mmetsp:Transcript_47594/g.121451  ORF Transcript_47594/g.121451 Transcript_47594/m.121451 type:complete len:210 (-) Transcript_47594:2-631(-)